MDCSYPQLVSEICLLFELGDPTQTVMSPLRGNANRLWKLETQQGTFVLKEFRYTIEDTRWVEAIIKAAEFELEIWRTNRLFMARPIPASNGALTQIIMGSRGRLALVRLHRWLDGIAIVKPVQLETVATAGSLLSEIHNFGRRFETCARGTLRWWRWDPKGILSRLLREGLVDVAVAQDWQDALADAEMLITTGQATPGPWAFSHYDFKPENTLSIDRSLAVLDWDEAALCHPRLAAIESALNWASIMGGRLNAEAFATFLDNYQRTEGKFGKLRPSDFAKRVASSVGWFEYLGRRALREFDDNDDEAAAALKEAVSEISSIAPTLTEIHTWINWAP